MRQIKKMRSQSGNLEIRVMENEDWDEFIVQMWSDGKHLKKSDYHTDDKEDAIRTAKSMIKATEKV